MGSQCVQVLPPQTGTFQSIRMCSRAKPVYTQDNPGREGVLKQAGSVGNPGEGIQPAPGQMPYNGFLLNW